MPQYWRLCIAAMNTPAPHCDFRQLWNSKPELHKIYLSGRAFSSKALDLAITVDLVVLEHSQLGLLAFVLYLLRGSVHLLLALLGTTT